jgi:hypothetical protein
LDAVEGAIEFEALTIRDISFDANHVPNAERLMKEAKIAEVRGTEANVPVGINSPKLRQPTEGLNQHLTLDVLGRPQAVVDAFVTRGH